MKLKNYALGQWVEGTGKSTTLFNAVTGEPVAEASSGGLDFKAMAEYGRRVGGPKLRAKRRSKRLTTGTRSPWFSQYMSLWR